ncbi:MULTISPECIES: M48 family metalloprotease [Qipengyuania]|uniref:M48 family metalloprotease n=2 Tax=Qipengyuania TaxID=1855416 RepID=A0A9Q3S0P9_9SPHN|nr:MULTISPECIES: M48 family metalloprotease [Qipengyuania]MBY6128449.1 M48 family metalloprotease [Qipengyuania aquimaris]MBY6218029.1 M48 family metalloprotease [Qipengyuania aquimaris]QZD93014.1 M48 family metalloprotease [Qipengyuania xiapuensis]UOR15137.1 M48 family metalloprotease [Qipengyuania aquimaris]
MSRTRIAATSTTAVLSLALAGCMGGNIPDASAPITQSEAQTGAEAHPQLLAEFGGAMTGSQAVYVEQVGKNIAVQSGLAGARDSFTVSLVNSPVNNAFAIPGGYVYTTRQLVTLMNNEAELAAVLGHEVGHVAARHSQRRQAAAQRNSILGAAGAILSGILLGGNPLGQQLGQAALQGSQLLTLKFSRSQELEADELGIRYLDTAGYDPRAMGTVLSSLAAQNALDARLQGRDDARLPEWASTHPDPASRVQTALNKAAGMTGTINRDTFLTRIDGLVYGDDPEQGVVEGRQFIHPELRLAFTAPQGFYMVNGTRAVTVNGQSGKAQFTLAQYNGDLNSYVNSVFSSLSQQQQIRPSNIQRTTVNGLPAAYGTARVNNGQSQVDVTVFAYEFSNDRAYHFLGITPAGSASTFNQMYSSVRRISTQEAASVVPRVLDVITVARGDTVASLSRRMAYSSAQEERFRVLNGLASGEEVQAGQKVKIVVRGS